MDRLRYLFSRPLPQVILVLSIAFLIYIFAARPKGEINDFTIVGDKAYLANGLGGLRIVNLEYPDALTEVGSYRCKGPFSALEDVSSNFIQCANRAAALATQDHYLFLVDQRSGLWVFDLEPDPSQPTLITQQRLQGRPQSLVILDDTIYVASGRAGIRVIKLTIHEDGNGEGEKQTPTVELKDQNVQSLQDIGNATAIYENEKFLYWVERNNILHILSIENPDKPKEVFSQKYKYPINDITFLDHYALVAAGKEGLIIFDKTDPAQLTQQTQLPMNGTANGLFLQGNNVYVVGKNIGLTVVDVTHIATPRIIPKPLEINGNPEQVIIKGTIGYVANGSNGLISLETKIEINFEPLGQSGSPVTAWDVDRAGEYAYLAAGERGLRVINVIDPAKPDEVGFLDTAGEAFAVDVAGASAFIADGKNGLVIANVTTPVGNLAISKQISTHDARDVAVSNSIAYIADFTDGLVIVDATDPLSASIVKIMDQPEGAAIHPEGVSVLADYVYLANGDRGLAIVNVVDKSIPTVVQQIFFPDQSDARSVAVIAFTPPPMQVPGTDPFAADPRNPSTAIYAYVANGRFGLQLLDVSNPRQTEAVQIPLSDQIKTIPGTAVDVSISRDRAYVAYDGGGVAILNTANPAAPELVGFLSLPQLQNRAAGIFADGSTAYLAAYNYGLQIIDATNTTAPFVIGKYSAPASVRNIAVQGDLAYTVDGERGLWIFAVADPKVPQEISFMPIPEAKGVFVADAYAYIAAGSNGLRIVNIADPHSPFIEGGLDTPGDAQSILVVDRPEVRPPGKYAYVSDGSNGLVIINVTDPKLPTLTSSLSQVGNAFRMTDNGPNYIYIAARQDGLVAVNVSDPANPSLGDRKQAGTTTQGVAVIQHQYAYTATGENGLVIFDTSFPLAFAPMEFNPVSTGEWLDNVAISYSNPIPGTVTSTVTTAPTFAFLAERAKGMEIMDTTVPQSPTSSGDWLGKSSTSAAVVDTIPDVVQVVPEWIPPAVEGDDPGHFRMYVADSTHGFSIVDGTKKASFSQLGLFETKGAPNLAALIDYLQAKANGQEIPSQKVALAVQQLLLDLVLLGIVGFFCWIGFLALFVLPIRHFADWENLYNRLLFYLFGRHGAAAVVKGGRLISSTAELGKRGPGVFMVDSSSAVILEKRGVRGSRAERLPLVRIASSNVVYSGNRTFLTTPAFDEILRGVADLRPQVRLAPRVFGHTRDGIEVETVIFTIFTLGEPADIVRVAYIPPRVTEDGQDIQEPYQPLARDLRVLRVKRLQNGSWQVESINDELDEADKTEIHQYIQTNPALNAFTIEDDPLNTKPNPGGTPFTVNSVQIFQALFAQADDLPENKQLDWTDLPNLVATEHFRNVLAAEAYDRLYNPLGSREDYPIQDLKANIRNWTRNQGILSYQFVRKLNSESICAGEIIPGGFLLGGPVRPLINPKILRVRGIKVKFAGFTELTPTDPEVRKQFFDYWQANREKEADIALGNYELRAARLQNKWRITAQEEILNELVAILDANPNASEALAIHVLQALEGAASDPDTSLLLPEDMINMLRNLRNWLLRP